MVAMDQTTEGVSARDSRFAIRWGVKGKQVLLELGLTAGLMIGQPTMCNARASVLHPKVITSNILGTTKWVMIFVNSVMSAHVYGL